MRILNTAELQKVANPKDLEALTAQPEPEPDLHLQALERLAQSINEMQEKQGQLFGDLLLAVSSSGSKKEITEQIAVLERLEKAVTSSMAAYSSQIATALTELKADTSQPDATDRLTRVVAMLTEQKGAESAETLSRIDQIIDKLMVIESREPIVNVDNPVTVEMPAPAKEFRVDVVRTPQGLIDHAVIKRES